MDGIPWLVNWYVLSHYYLLGLSLILKRGLEQISCLTRRKHLVWLFTNVFGLILSDYQNITPLGNV